MRRPFSIFAMILAPLGLVTLALSPMLYPDGAKNIPPGHAGGPVINDVGGQTCSASGCHVGSTPTSGALSAPNTYEVGGSAIQFQVTGVRGMQATVTNQAGTAHVGTLQEGGGLAFAQGNSNYVTHELAHSTPGSYTITWQPPSTDIGDVRIYVAGSNGFLSQTWTVSARLEAEVSNTLPTVEITDGPTGTVSERDVLFSWSGSDPDGSVTDYFLTLDGPTPSTLTTSETSHEFTGLANGAYTFEIRGMDDDGALSPLVSQSFEVDAPNIAPTVSIASGPSGTIRQPTASFQWQGSDADGSVAEYEVELDGPTSSSFTTVFQTRQFEALEDGEYTFQVRAIDNEGAASDWAVRAFVVQVNTPNAAPTASFEAQPGTGTASLTVVFDASASSDADGSIVGWSWDFGDEASGAGESVDHTYATAGTYTVTLTVTDDDDATASSSQDITVVSEPVSAEGAPGVPESFAIESIYPNPFNPATTVVVAATRAGVYSLQAYDMLGKLVFRSRLDFASPGRQEVEVTLGDRPSGVYLLHVVEEANGRRVTAEATLLK